MEERKKPDASRRQVVAGAAAAVGATAAAGLLGSSSDVPERAVGARMPTVYLPHGGGPYSYVDMGLPEEEVEALADYWRGVASLGGRRPRALLVVSAHWEAPVPTVMTAAHPRMYYDYSGFPPESYQLQWPAPGAPEVAQRARELLRVAGIESAADPERGFDHGTFIPLGRSFPAADVPTFQLALKSGLDPSEHLAIGAALSPLRDEGVLIVGSGMSYHNMRGFFAGSSDDVDERFDAWLREAVSMPAEARNERLIHWETAPAARAAHPREEHLLPLMVVAGAAHDDVASVPFRGKAFGRIVSAIHFG